MLKWQYNIGATLLVLGFYIELQRRVQGYVGSKSGENGHGTGRIKRWFQKQWDAEIALSSKMQT